AFARMLIDDGGSKIITDIASTPAAAFSSLPTSTQTRAPAHSEDPLDLSLISDTGFTLNQGFSDSAFWLKIPVKNPTLQQVERLVVVGNPQLEDVSFYLVSEDSAEQFYFTGSSKPFYERPWLNTAFVFPVNLAAQSEAQIYLRIHSNKAVFTTIAIKSHQSFQFQEGLTRLLMGIFGGLLFAFSLFHFGLYFSNRSRQYLFHAIMSLSFVLLLLQQSGTLYPLLWPEFEFWNAVAGSVFAIIAGLFTALFSYDYLNIRRYRKPRSVFVLLCFLSTLALVNLLFLLKPEIYFQIAIPFTLVALVIGLGISLSGITRPGYKTHYHCLGLFSLTIGVLCILLVNLQFSDSSWLLNVAWPVACTIHVFAQSVALFDKQHEEKMTVLRAQDFKLAEEKALIEDQQAALLKERKTNEEQYNTLFAQQQSQAILEKKIKKRTEELDHAKQQITELTITDGLTGLKNRRYLDEIYYTECKRAQRQQTWLAIVLAELDDYFEIIEELGEQAAQKALAATARQLKKASGRASDVVARYDVATFCLLLPNTPDNAAQDIAETLRANIENTLCEFENQQMKLTISLGLACVVPQSVADGFHLADNSHKALMEAKKKGGNQVVYFTPEHDV
ncbi:MAG: diguanylate cyclase, partial [Pseudomonadales bacterium]|nr:diguanylate cyclase [Pseudomonadales bacterium]